MHEYDLISDWYASERDNQTGVAEAAGLALSLAPGSRILDAGCGTGFPIAQMLLGLGHRVVGLDTSSRMLEKFRGNCPEASATLGSIQICPFDDASFDAAVAIGVMFHLTPDDQVRAIASIARILRPSAPFLFTSGDVDGFEGKEDTMHDVVFRYYSFSPENYRRHFEEQGFTLEDVHKDAGQNTYYLARKR